MSKDEAAIEAEIQAKGLNAPRLNPQMIDETIVSEQYHVFPSTTMTICALSLRNGFIVTGESAAASPANFDPAIGRKIARENARNKIWALEGYLLRSKLAANEIPADRAGCSITARCSGGGPFHWRKGHLAWTSIRKPSI